MTKIKIKSFNDAVRDAIKIGAKNDVIVRDDKEFQEFDALYGINRNWYGWDNTICAWLIKPKEFDGFKHVYYYDGKYHIPEYCVEYVTED